jgi:hypothetical protein
MPYLKPAVPMQNRSTYMPGYMYQLHISWHFFDNLSIFREKLMLSIPAYNIQHTVQAVSGSWYKRDIVQRRSEHIPVGFQ